MTSPWGTNEVLFGDKRAITYETGEYTHVLIADEGIIFMEWLGKDSDETDNPQG